MTVYRFMTLNMLTDSLYAVGNARFRFRVRAIEEMIRVSDPDVIGVQEMTKTMMPYMSNIFVHYRMAGVSRSSLISDEFTAVLFSKDRFRLTRSNTMWLSDDPFRKGSKVRLSQFPRTVTYTVLYDEAAQDSFTFFNTHLDQNLGVIRTRQAEILSTLITHYQSGSFTVLTGDFNDGPDSSALRILHTCGLKNTVDPSVGSTLRGRIGSALQQGRPIDHILVSAHMHVLSLRKLDGKYAGIYPSDHYPLLAEVSDCRTDNSSPESFFE